MVSDALRACRRTFRTSTRAYRWCHPIAPRGRRRVPCSQRRIQIALATRLIMLSIRSAQSPDPDVQVIQRVRAVTGSFHRVSREECAEIGNGGACHPNARHSSRIRRHEPSARTRATPDRAQRTTHSLRATFRSHRAHGRMHRARVAPHRAGAASHRTRATPSGADVEPHRTHGVAHRTDDGHHLHIAEPPSTRVEAAVTHGVALSAEGQLARAARAPPRACRMAHPAVARPPWRHRRSPRRERCRPRRHQLPSVPNAEAFRRARRQVGPRREHGSTTAVVGHDCQRVRRNEHAGGQHA
jgi:hypothetical protein